MRPFSGKSSARNHCRKSDSESIAGIRSCSSISTVQGILEHSFPARSSQPTFDSTHCPLPTACCLLPTACCLPSSPLLEFRNFGLRNFFQQPGDDGFGVHAFGLGLKVGAEAVAQHGDGDLFDVFNRDA